ncbi:MAG: hypothetical protein R3D03_14070 [Geminicoccaceae bacterium]
MLRCLFTAVTLTVLLVCGEARAFEVDARAAILLVIATTECFSPKSRRGTAAGFDEQADDRLGRLRGSGAAASRSAENCRSARRAWRMGGSRMFVEVNTREGARPAAGVIVQSGNDACIVLAEAVSGSEQAFVDRMNARTRPRTQPFRQRDGWPAEPLRRAFVTLPRSPASSSKNIPNITIYSVANSSTTASSRPTAIPCCGPGFRAWTG